MMRARTLAVAALVATWLVVGCSKPSTEGAEGGTAAASSASGAAAAASASAAAAASASAAAAEPEDEPPNEHKADGKASREITKANYKTELTKMEKEIGNP
jgi:hypothetical protein